MSDQPYAKRREMAMYRKGLIAGLVPGFAFWAVVAAAFLLIAGGAQ